MFRVDHDPNKMANACKLMVQMCNHYGVIDCLMEYQAPMGAPVVCRWNSYVEGALAACLSYKHITVHTLQPGVVKRKLKLATGNYAENKKVAYAYAAKKCPMIDSHHLADCFILADYWKMTQTEEETESKDSCCFLDHVCDLVSNSNTSDVCDNSEQREEVLKFIKILY
jgi:hypothetical protein